MNQPLCRRQGEPYSDIIPAPLMRRPESITRLQLVRTALSVCVICCLCFSVGEGLRLTPFPVSPQTIRAGEPDSQFKVTVQSGTMLHRSGPLDVPTQGHVQKRGKRLIGDYGCPPSLSARNPPTDLLIQLNLDEPVGFTSSTHVSRPFDRGPPFTG